MANGERIILGLAEVLAFYQGEAEGCPLSVVAKVDGRSRRYQAVIQGEPGAFGISFPDVPGRVVRGETVAEVVELAAWSWANTWRV
jgi:hypothetical protein